jgi:predicted O-methyltransferase YrrM
MKLNTLLKMWKYVGLKRYKQFSTYNIPTKNSLNNEYAGTVDDTEYNALVDLAKATNDSHTKAIIIEIGALFGLSTQALLEGGGGLKVITIDNFTWNPIGLTPDRHEQMLRSNLNYFIRQGRLEIFKGSSSEYLKNRYSGEKVAMVFIDADHSYEGVLKDIYMAESVDAKIVSGDDYSFPGVRRAVEERYGGFVRHAGDMWWVDRGDLRKC